MSSNRRDFLKSVTTGAAGLAVGTAAVSMPASSYGRVLGANDRLGVGIIGLGRRLKAFIPPVSNKESNVELLYLCDVMKSQRAKAAGLFAEQIKHDAKLENDIRKVIDDPKVDVILNATPDHWHAPGTIMALKGGKHVYVEKPATHNMLENELTDIKDVASVRCLGRRDRELWVEVDPAKLKEFHVSMQEIMDALRTKNITVPGGGAAHNSSN